MTFFFPSHLGGGHERRVVDAPCSGTGAWRRKPETKWKLNQAKLDLKVRAQRDILTNAAKMVKRGGRLFYLTCSILPEENTDQMQWFLLQHPQFNLVPYSELWKESPLLSGKPPLSADGRTDSLLLTPRQSDTDGFFISCFLRRH